MNKFNKFFTETAINQSKDAWWDPSQKCVMTKADEEWQVYSLPTKI